MDDKEILERYGKFVAVVKDAIEYHLPNAKLLNSDITHHYHTMFLATIKYGTSSVVVECSAEDSGLRWKGNPGNLTFLTINKLKELAFQYCKDHDPAKH